MKTRYGMSSSLLSGFRGQLLSILRCPFPIISVSPPIFVKIFLSFDTSSYTCFLPFRCWLCTTSMCGYKQGSKSHLRWVSAMVPLSHPRTHICPKTVSVMLLLWLWSTLAPYFLSHLLSSVSWVSGPQSSHTTAVRSKVGPLVEGSSPRELQTHKP